MDQEKKSSTIPERIPIKLNAHDSAIANIKLVLVPGTSIGLPGRRGCQPRMGAPRDEKDPIPLPDPIRLKLLQADKLMTAWLKAPENAAAFIKDPMGALKLAGVQMERSELKAIARARAELSQDAVLREGVKLGTVEALFNPSAKAKAEPTNDKDCGCKHE